MSLNALKSKAYKIFRNLYWKFQTGRDPEFEFRETLVVIEKTKLQERIGKETLIVCGSPRGLTSLVSYTLYELDYFIGKKLNSRNYEDKIINDAFPRKLHSIRPLRWQKNLRRIIQERNRSHRRWGFKLPRASDFISEFPAVFRQPVCVLCVRNMVGGARSIHSRSPDKTAHLTGILHRSTKSMRALMKLSRRDDLPAIIINMDEAQKNPRLFLEEFTELLQIDGDLDRVAANIAERGYKVLDKAKPAAETALK